MTNYIPLFFLSATLVVVAGKIFIEKARYWIASRVRDYTPERHQMKNKTPTMGGAVFVPLILFLTFFLVPCSKAVIWFLAVILSFALIGFLDDWYKLVHSRGITAFTKWCLQLVASLGAACGLYWLSGSAALFLPFTSQVLFELHPLFYLLWVMFVFLAMTNAVNITDGLDGLATSIISAVLLFFLVCVLCFSEAVFLLPPNQLCRLLFICLGACIGFLYLNWNPALIFMGDVGSLALGALLAAIAFLMRSELILPIVGVVFVVEIASVILQVASFKIRKKRIFKMAPLHHHFELIGWSEKTIVMVSAAVTALLGILIFILMMKLQKVF